MIEYKRLNPWNWQLSDTVMFLVIAMFLASSIPYAWARAFTYIIVLWTVEYIGYEKEE